MEERERVIRDTGTCDTEISVCAGGTCAICDGDACDGDMCTEASGE